MVRAIELNDKNILYYKLGQACVTNWGSFILLQIKVTFLQIGTALLLQIGAAITK